MAQAQPKIPANASGKSTTQEPNVDDLYAMMDILKTDLKQLTETVAGVGKAEARKAGEAVAGKGRDIRKAGEDGYDALRASSESYGREAGRYVREQPVTALGLAAGVGLLVGFLMSNRR